MAEKTLASVNITVNEEGYLEDMTQWNKEIAVEIAKEEGIDLTEKHFQLIEFLRSKVEKGDTLTIRSVGKSGVCDIKEFYQLFPGGPLKKATKISGIKKPTSCV